MIWAGLPSFWMYFFNLDKTIMKTKKKGTTIKNWSTYAADGTWLDFGDQVNSIEEITPGMTATLISDGANPGGVPNGALSLIHI